MTYFVGILPEAKELRNIPAELLVSFAEPPWKPPNPYGLAEDAPRCLDCGYPGNDKHDCPGLDL